MEVTPKPTLSTFVFYDTVEVDVMNLVPLVKKGGRNLTQFTKTAALESLKM